MDFLSRFFFHERREPFEIFVRLLIVESENQVEARVVP